MTLEANPGGASSAPRTDLFVTTAMSPSPEMRTRADALAHELNATTLSRRVGGMTKLWAKRPAATIALVVQSDRLVLMHRSGVEMFYHPNMAFLRLGNVLRGSPDTLLSAADLAPGDSVLDCTLGYASEAILCAHVVGETGEVHGIEAVPELGIVVREGLQTVETAQTKLNDAMRRVRVVHLGNHLDYLRACPTYRYDVICFDPFFDETLEGSEQFAPIRSFGDSSPLSPEAVEEARRIARRRILVKATRRSPLLETLGIAERYESRGGKVVYGVLRK